MPQHFQTEQWLPYPPELVFAFFANPENLPRLMPRWQSARIEEAHFFPPPPRPEGAPRYPGIVAGDGTRLNLTIRPFPFSPIRLPWAALIENFQWNHGFCDIQVSGPFRSWRHCHTVQPAIHPETSQHGSTVRDEVTFEHLLAPLMKPGIAYIFRYRQRRTEELLALMSGRRKG
jgi:ligand-binding SRPBCC domain-containing protein